MANRNATRHLLLVASVLLCFFVYMGYRLAGGSTDSAAPSAPALSPSGGMDIAAIAASGSGNGFPGDAALRPPAAAPGGFASTPPARPASGGDGGPMLLSPIGSAEEAAPALTPPPAASAAASANGAISGLVPAPPMPRPPAAPNSASPDDAPSPASAPSASSLPPGLLSPPGGRAEAPNRTSPPADAGEGSTTAPAGLRPSSGSPPPLTPPAAAPVAPPPLSPAVAATTTAAETPPPLPPVRRERPAVVPPPDAVPPAGVLAAGDEAPSDSLRMYVVRPGDTLSRIATRELGSISLADNIFLLNRDVIPDPDQLMAGVKIRLPVRSPAGMDAGLPSVRAEEHGDWSAPASASGGMAAEQVRVHTVAPGDTLSSISMRYYGSSSGWRFLHEVNAKTISNPNRLAVGTELVVPPYGEEQ